MTTELSHTVRRIEIVASIVIVEALTYQVRQQVRFTLHRRLVCVQRGDDVLDLQVAVLNCTVIALQTLCALE